MKYKHILITGGAGFVGSNIAFKLKRDYPNTHIYCFDNLTRRGSELNIARLQRQGITFIHGDIRNQEDFSQLTNVDLCIECAAEPSVLAGIVSSLRQVININLLGTINCLEFAKEKKSDFIFLSTSRVYPIEPILHANILELETRFEFAPKQHTTGISQEGISEKLPLVGSRSFYGATKLSCELLISEYNKYYDIKSVVNRCGLLAGPWQMGKGDQGIISFWVATHYFKRKLEYIGFGGTGKQVRDVLHIEDLYNLLNMQIQDIDKFNSKTFNVGGGKTNSISLQELTLLCQKIVGNEINITKRKENRSADLPIFITDYSALTNYCGWKPTLSVENVVIDIFKWIKNNKQTLSYILNP